MINLIYFIGRLCEHNHYWFCRYHSKEGIFLIKICFYNWTKFIILKTRSRCLILTDHLSTLCQLPCSQNYETRNFFTQNARNYQLTWVPVDSSPRRISIDQRWNYLAQVLFASSHRHLSVDRRWNYSARVLANSSPRRPSVDRSRNYLDRVLVIYISTDVENVDSHPSRLSFHCRNL